MRRPRRLASSASGISRRIGEAGSAAAPLVPDGVQWGRRKADAAGDRRAGGTAMAIRAVGLLSPGDMGHSIGAVLHQRGLPVLTCLVGRSERTRALAAEAGIEDAPTLDELVRAVDVLLCVL